MVSETNSNELPIRCASYDYNHFNKELHNMDFKNIQTY